MASQPAQDIRCEHCGQWMERWGSLSGPLPDHPECADCRRFSLHIEPLKEVVNAMANAVNALLLKLQSGG
jgi:hypothetical protein